MTTPYYQDEYVTIYHGDCREILPELPKVDLVLTDPIYQNIDDYQWLLNTSSEKLNEHGQLIAYIADMYLPDLMKLDFNGLTWGKLIIERNVGSKGTLWKLHCKTGCKHAMWFYKESLPEDINWTTDFIYCIPDGKNVNHKWSKNIPSVTELITRHTKQDYTILDPFNGGGTSTWCAKKLNRKCIGIDIKEEYCEIAANRCRQMVMELNI